MAKIRIKRSTANSDISNLMFGELAYTANGQTLAIGDANGTTVFIGGKRAPGVLTANQALVANSTSGIDRVIAGTVVANTLTASSGNGTAGQVLLTTGNTIYWGTGGVSNGSHGPFVLSNVVAVNTTYITANAAVNSEFGVFYLLTVPAKMAATPRLSINGATSLTLREADGSAGGSALGDSYLQANTTHIISETADGTYMIHGQRFTEVRNFGTTYIHGGTRNLYHYGNTNLNDVDQPASRILFSSNTSHGGRIIFYTGGIGNTSTGTAPVAAMEIGTTQGVRFFGDILNSQGLEYYSASAPSDDLEDVLEYAEFTSAPSHEAAVEPIAVSSNNVHLITGSDISRQSYVTVNSVVDIEHMRGHTEHTSYVRTGATADFYTGTNTAFLNMTSQFVRVSGPAIIKIWKGQGQNDAFIKAEIGSVADVTRSDPVYGRTWIGLGQSWINRAFHNGMSGAQQTYKTWQDAGNSSIDTSIRAINCAQGASALLKNAPSSNTNYWWDQESNTPGPNALLAANTINSWIAANPTQPAPEAAVWNYGLNDMNANVWSSTGNNTPELWTASQKNLITWLNANCALPDLKHFIVPVPAWKESGVFPENGWYAMRRAQLQCAVDEPTVIFRGPEMYDLGRIWADEHHNFGMQKRWGARLPLFIETKLGRRTEDLGPRIVDFTEVDSTTFKVWIDRGGFGGFDRPDAPLGFALLPAGSNYFDEPLEITSYAWGYDFDVDLDTLTLTIETASSGARLCYPYGSNYLMRSFSRIVRNTTTVMPLRAYHSGLEQI